MGWPRPKDVALFVMHTFLAMVGSIVSGFLIFLIFKPLVGYSNSPLFDVPYSPLDWGSGLFLGFLVNNFSRNGYARWVWLIALLWLSFSLADEKLYYDPRWTYGMSLPEVIWYSYFSISNEKCTQECLGKLFATAPMVTSIAYSIGAALGLRFKALIQLNRTS
jgi:hypothetical protein